MKNIVSFIFLLALLVSGCSQEEILKNGTTSVSGKGRIFTTEFEQNDSRTYVENGLYSRWTEGDCISLFDASTLNCRYLFAGDTGDSGGTFFMLSKPVGTSTTLNTNYAVYPYSGDVKMMENGVISVTLPSEQHYAENSYGLGDNTMVAVTEDADDTFLSFKNVGGCLKLQLYGDDVTVKSITLMGNDGEKIAGKATLTAAYDKTPVVTMSDDATTSITLDCGEKGVKIGSSAEDATAFWMVVPPTTFEKGITVKIMDMNGKMFIPKTEKQLVIERNVVKPMAAVKVKPETPVVYSTDEEILEGWSEGLFGGEGTYMMGKPHGDNGYMMTIGHIISGETAIVYLDASRQIREIFVGNTIITLGENINGTMEVSFIEKDGVETMEHITLNVNSRNSHNSRSSGDHSQQAGTINFVLNMQSVYEGVKDLLEHDVFSNKGAFGSLKAMVNAPTVGNNLIKACGGPDLLGADSTTEMIGQWLDWAQSAVDFAELGRMFIKPVGVGGPAGACIAAWAGCYAKYLELYDKYIGLYFGNSVATIGEITLEGNELNIEVKVPGFETWYNIECGVIVANKSFPSPRFSNDLETAEVTKDGEYTFTLDMMMDEAYYFRPFLVTKDRTSLWKGFIGDLAGPLVRYGETVQYQTPLREALIKLYQDTNGDNWTNNTNWCSDKPVTEWYGITKNGDNEYTLMFDNNNLKGKIEQTFPEDVSILLLCGNNQLTSVDLSGGHAIKSLYFYEQALTSVNVSDCKSLEKLVVQGCGQLTSLDANNCESMKFLNCGRTQLTSLNIFNCNALESIQCSMAKLTELDISAFQNLTYLECSNNQLSKLDLSHNTKLVSLYCYGNNLTSLDVSKCNKLRSLSCGNNPINTLEISNHPSLENLSYDGMKGEFSLTLSNCTALKYLLVWYDEISSITIKDCTALSYVDIGETKASSVEISGCSALKGISSPFLHINSLSVSDCPSFLVIQVTGLEKLNLSNCPSLTSLALIDSKLSSLDVSPYACLEGLSLGNSQISTLNASGCTALKRINIDFDANISTLNVSGCTSLSTLSNCRSIGMISLDASGCTSLKTLYCDHNQLTSLDASGCASLESLDCRNNQITTLNVSGCSAMTQLVCIDNQITSLNVEGCSSLTHLYCYNNKINSVIPDWFSQLQVFSHDKKYRYWNVWSDLINDYVTHHADNGYGWWYPGEPEKGYHGPN